jgi:hypothetical protein
MVRCLPIAAVAALSLFAAGCGGHSTSPGVAGESAATTTGSATQIGPVAFTRCMRSHGLANFPDPDANGGIPKTQVVRVAKADPSKFNAAQSACNHLVPADGIGDQQTPAQQRRQLADELSFARCMRGHGLARFPDPTVQGGLTVEMVQAQGIDVHSTAILRVVQTCLPASHGGLTLQKVREALSHTG